MRFYGLNAELRNTTPAYGTYTGRRAGSSCAAADSIASSLIIGHNIWQYRKMHEAPLDPRIDQSLRNLVDQLARSGEVLPREKLEQSYATFRARFGPDQLRAVNGEELLQLMHTHGNKESLVYWLEFKKDEELPAHFGSIAGGSAHKFGLFRRIGSDQWVTGSPQNEKNISKTEAIGLAQKHRDQLLAGVEILQEFQLDATDEEYLRLQRRLDEVAPDVSTRAWGHKYFHLLCPDKLDDFHREPLQRFMLIKCLKLPPEQNGLYVAAGRFVRLAKHFDWPMNYLTSALNRRNGQLIRYWRIGTRLSGAESIWSQIRDGSFVAIGWEKLGDLSTIGSGDNLRNGIRTRLAADYPHDPKTLSRKAGEIANFVERIEENDVVVAAEDDKVLGVGRVTGPYWFENTPPTGAPHRRPVQWISTSTWRMPDPEGKLTTVFPIQQHESNLVEIERHLLEGEQPGETKPTRHVSTGRTSPEGLPGRIEAVLTRKGQVILYGPPGTGKTFWARRTSFELAALHTFARPFDDLSVEEKAEIEGEVDRPRLVRSCTFHPSYGYEDFIEGFRPHTNAAGELLFELRPGIFQRICADAEKQIDRKFFLIIDEINRGDIPRIFGELITLLELDKRNKAVTLTLSGKSFSVPPNVYIIGTMNTADRSIALLDTALRRRFGFIELMPDVSVLGSASVGGSIPLGAWLTALNDRIRAGLGRDSRNLQVGHAYFLKDGAPITDYAAFVRILAEDIVPLLEEYCYEDYGALAKVLGAGIVDVATQRIRNELFAPGRRDDLVQALLEPAAEVLTSTGAVTEEVEQPESEVTDA